MLVVFEGMDGAGKSSLSSFLYEKLLEEAFPAVLYREPGGTPMGEYIRDGLKSSLPREDMTDFLLMNASRLELMRKIGDAKNKIIILDRYYYSSMVYQQKSFQDHPLLCTAITNLFPKPDLVFYVQIKPHVALERKSQRNRLLDVTQGIETQATLLLDDSVDPYELRNMSEIYYKYENVMRVVSSRYILDGTLPFIDNTELAFKILMDYYYG